MVATCVGVLVRLLYRKRQKLMLALVMGVIVRKWE